MMPYKSVIFDMDNTLYDESSYFLAVAYRFLQDLQGVDTSHSLSMTEKMLSMTEKSPNMPSHPVMLSETKHLDSNNIDVSHSLNMTEKSLSMTASKILPCLESSDIFKSFLESINLFSVQNHNKLFELYQNINCEITLYPQVAEIFDFFKQRGKKIAILTNGVIKAQKNKARLLGLDKLVPIIYAREFGKNYEKPHFKAFESALDMLDSKPFQTIMIGDSLKNDIIPAIENDFYKAIWINPLDKKPPQHIANATNFHTIKNLTKDAL